jgi:hypothetical protein
LNAPPIESFAIPAIPGPRQQPTGINPDGAAHTAEPHGGDASRPLPVSAFPQRIGIGMGFKPYNRCSAGAPGELDYGLAVPSCSSSFVVGNSVTRTRDG